MDPPFRGEEPIFIKTPGLMTERAESQKNDNVDSDRPAGVRDLKS
jgi:hypothetical protein